MATPPLCKLCDVRHWLSEAHKLPAATCPASVTVTPDLPVTVTPARPNTVTVTVPKSVTVTPPVTVTLYAPCPECEGTGRILASVLKARMGSAARQRAYRGRQGVH